ncbi:unnamed protein product [Cuscuta epithymum]|uniref:E3 SUMO-protein ligase SIZ1 n=1 Tax=Cuscuta epithymum TaxID=186058 RepID=A0AAV0G6J3_9ASTE|nr:unnamed protein product [Cuscuta epithymum]CAH9143596.1 unnamed protein product [Cuscuta epithymum]
MDSLGDLKDKLAKFRIKELKDALTKLGLPKQGTKKVLFDRILAIFYDDQGMCAKKTVIAKEKVVNIVDDIYRKMHVYGTPDSASKPLGFSHGSTVKLNDEIEDYNKTYRIQCPCGNTVQTESMIKCEDPKCHVWQHIRCVVIPEKDVESGIPTTPHKTFYCELCRLSRLDPFWESVSNPLLPVKLTITDIPPDGTSPVQSIEKTFQLTRAETDLVEKQEYDIQAWCMLLNDKVQFRMHWPLHTSLQLNGVPVRVINRPGSQLLGANGRDDGPIITTCIREGINKISMAGIDARVFCFGVRVVKKRTVQQILNCIPKESDGERFEDALARVCRVGGGDVAENADSDSDLQIVDDFISVNLRCPMSGSRIKVAGRFQPCTHKGCFDLEVFVEINRRSRKWQCPICLKNYSLEHIIIDPYLNRITSKLKNCGENVMEIEVKHDGSWRVKAGGDLGSLGDLVQWHLPNGNLCTSSDAESDKPNLEILKSQDGCSNGHGNLRVGLKKNPNGVWQISKPEEIIAMSSSSDTVIGKEGCDDVSVNQDYSGVENEPVQLGNGELIVLSDSDEENELLMIPGNEVPTHSFQKNGIPDSYGNEDRPTFPDSRIGILNTTTTIDINNEFGIETWPSPHNIQRLDPGFQIFGSNADVQHNPISGCGFPTDMGSVGAVTESSVVYANANINSSLVVNNPFSFGDVDPSLQMFIPNIPSDTSSMADPNMRDQPLDATTCAPSEDWFSLSLGSGGDIGATSDSTGANGLNSVSVNDNKSNKTCREGPGSPFAFPRKRRSARPRPYPNIDYFDST